MLGRRISAVENELSEASEEMSGLGGDNREGGTGRAKGCGVDADCRSRV